jgi:hypothetical protein
MFGMAQFWRAPWPWPACAVNLEGITEGWRT